MRSKFLPYLSPCKEIVLSYQMDLRQFKLYWIIGRISQLSPVNQLHFYKAILKPIWTYGVQLRGTASDSNLKILEKIPIESVTDIYGRTVVCAEFGDKK